VHNEIQMIPEIDNNLMLIYFNKIIFL
jgi:hypothetical protein